MTGRVYLGGSPSGSKVDPLPGIMLRPWPHWDEGLLYRSMTAEQIETELKAIYRAEKLFRDGWIRQNRITRLRNAWLQLQQASA